MSYPWTGLNKPGVQSDSTNQVTEMGTSFLLLPSLAPREKTVSTVSLPGLLTVVLSLGMITDMKHLVQGLVNTKV